jgi:hypothetical protein
MTAFKVVDRSFAPDARLAIAALSLRQAHQLDSYTAGEAPGGENLPETKNTGFDPFLSQGSSTLYASRSGADLRKRYLEGPTSRLFRTSLHTDWQVVVQAKKLPPGAQ